MERLGALGTVPVSARIIVAILTATYALAWIPGTIEFFAMVPRNILPPTFSLWTLVTAGWFEATLLSLVANAFAVLMIARHVEPIWGTREFFKFVALVNVVATALSFLACVLLWLILPQETVLFGEFSGFTGVTGALTVALKQAMPEERAKIFVVVPVQMKHVPLVFIAVVAVFGLAGGTLVDLPFIVFGVAVGWVYLRFYQERDGVVGDLSEAFSFASFFPDPMQPAMGRVSTFVYATLVRCKCCKPRTTAVDATGNYHHVMEAAGQAPETASGNALIGASDVTEAERRRERALAILAERLAREEAAQTPRGAMNGADMV